MERRENRTGPCGHESSARVYGLGCAACLSNQRDELLEACKRIDAAPYGVALGDLELLRSAISKVEGKAKV